MLTEWTQFDIIRVIVRMPSTFKFKWYMQTYLSKNVEVQYVIINNWYTALSKWLHLAACCPKLVNR